MRVASVTTEKGEKMTLAKAVNLVITEYERAQKMAHIHNPIAWALYQVWKKADGEAPQHGE